MNLTKTTILCIVSVLGFCALYVAYRQREKEATVFLITPTHPHPTQQAELVRLCTVLNFAGNVYWIVVEDRESNNVQVKCAIFVLNSNVHLRCMHHILTSRELNVFLKGCGIPYTLLHAKSPAKGRTSVRGSAQRNAALTWLRRNYQPYQISGVVYFADDDNTYHPQIFNEMRTIKRGGTWPVGLLTGSTWEGCLTYPSDRKKVAGFWTNWKPTRPFPIDMAAFAVHLDVILTHPDALFDYKTVGLQEGLILSGLGFKSGFDLEPKADGCTKLLVWHTQSIQLNTQVPAPETIFNLI